jgi:hypothetical protein
MKRATPGRRTLGGIRIAASKTIIARALSLLLILGAARPEARVDADPGQAGEAGVPEASEASGSGRQSKTGEMDGTGAPQNGRGETEGLAAEGEGSTWFAAGKFGVLVGCLVCAAAVFAGLGLVRRRKDVTLRGIAGLAALDDAVGRATEMGRPVLYSPGISPMSRVSTMASMNILKSVAERAAEHGTPLIVPCAEAVVMTVAQEVVREGCLRVGRPDAYDESSIFFLTESQFGYAAAVDGLMLRERPATNIFMGSFGAESLILAETGNVTGAIQVAGTDSTIQLAFFLVTCDYTLIGEELYAASAYLSRDPSLLGCLVGQDWLKIAAILLAALGAVLRTFGVGWLARALVR